MAERFSTETHAVVWPSHCKATPLSRTDCNIRGGCDRRLFGGKMLTALILICSITRAPEVRDCNIESASAVVRVPDEFGNPATCFMHGQAYLAQSAIGQELGEDDRVRVLCARSKKVHASSRAF